MIDTRRCGQCAGTGKIDSGAPDQYGGFYEVGCPQCNGTGSVALRGPVRVDDPPEDNVPVLAICQDGQYRTMKYSADDGRWYGGDGWEMHGASSPLYWWELPEVTHD